MAWHVLHVTFITHVLRPGGLWKAIKEYFTFNRRMGMLKKLFTQEAGFKNIQLYTELSPTIYQSGLGFTQNKIVFFRRRNKLQFGRPRIIPNQLYAFACVYSTDKGKVTRLGKRLEEKKENLKRKYTLIKDIFVYPEIRDAQKVDIRRWDVEAYRLYKQRR